MNKVFFIGNLTRDPELTETASGVSVCKFSIAVNRNYTNGDGERETDFFDCTAWRGTAEAIARYCKKGNKIAVTGSVQTRTYEGNDGVKRLAVDVIVQETEFLTPKPQADEDRSFAESRDARRSSGKRAMQTFDDDDDIPF